MFQLGRVHKQQTIDGREWVIVTEFDDNRGVPVQETSRWRSFLRYYDNVDPSSMSCLLIHDDYTADRP